MWHLTWILGALLHFFNQVIRASAKGILHPSTVDMDHKRLCFSRTAMLKPKGLRA